MKYHIAKLELYHHGRPYCIQYKTIGHGPLILYIHGWSHSSQIWDKVLPILYQQFPHCTHLALDLPGFGNSTIPRGFDHNLAHYAECLRDFIAQIGLPPAAIISHSMGGLIASLYLQNYGGEFPKIAICGSPLAGASFLRPLFYIPGLVYGAIASRNLVPNFILRQSGYVAIASHNFHKIPPDMWSDVRRANTASMSQCLRQVAFFSPQIWSPSHTWTQGKQILLLRGEKEIIMTKAVADQFAELWHTELVTLPNVSHTYALESPDEFAQALANFLIHK